MFTKCYYVSFPWPTLIYIQWAKIIFLIEIFLALYSFHQLIDISCSLLNNGYHRNGEKTLSLSTFPVRTSCNLSYNITIFLMQCKESSEAMDVVTARKRNPPKASRLNKLFHNRIAYISVYGISLMLYGKNILAGLCR